MEYNARTTSNIISIPATIVILELRIQFPIQSECLNLK